MLSQVWGFISSWYNLPFSLLLALAVVLAVLQLVGLGGEADDDADADAEVEAEADVDADADADTDSDSDAEAEAADGNTPFAWLAQLGVGKAPLLIVLLILFSAIGGAGWLLNALIASFFGTYPGLAFALALPLAVVAGGTLTARVAGTLGRALPPVSTTASRAEALVGQAGTVVSPYVDQAYGQVNVRNAGGTRLSLFAVTRFDQPIRRGERVVLVDYDSAHRHYVVTRAAPDHSPP